MENEPKPELLKGSMEITQAPTPELMPGETIRLLRVDGSQAYFIDAKGHGWYFNSGQRIWRAVDPRDMHPMATQFTKRYQPGIDTFNSVEDAALHAIKFHFIDRVDMHSLVFNDPEAVGPKWEGIKKDLAHFSEKCQEVIRCIERIEQETDSNEKARLKKELETLLEKIEKENDEEETVQEKSI